MISTHRPVCLTRAMCYIPKEVVHAIFCFYIHEPGDRWARDVVEETLVRRSQIGSLCREMYYLYSDRSLWCTLFNIFTQPKSPAFISRFEDHRRSIIPRRFSFIHCRWWVLTRVFHINDPNPFSDLPVVYTPGNNITHLSMIPLPFTPTTTSVFFKT